MLCLCEALARERIASVQVVLEEPGPQADLDRYLQELERFSGQVTQMVMKLQRFECTSECAPYPEHGA